MSFQKDRRLSVSTKLFRRTVSLGHRRLRFSFQINDFKDQDRDKPAKPFNARSRRRRCLPPLIFRVKQFFLKNFLSTLPIPKDRRRRLSKESQTPSQQGFSTFSAKLETEAPSHRSRPARFRTPRPARFQASGGYTDPSPSPQDKNDRFTNYLDERESKSAAQNRTPPSPYIEGRQITSTSPRRPPSRLNTQGGEILRHPHLMTQQTRPTRRDGRSNALLFHI